MYIVLNVNNSNEFTDTLYIMLTILVAGYKQVYMWVDRKNFVIMINVQYQPTLLRRIPQKLRETWISYGNAYSFISQDQYIAILDSRLDVHLIDNPDIRVHGVGETQSHV